MMINGYHVVSKWTNVGSGSAEWCFATKGGKEWFVKRFLSPVFPAKHINMPADLRRKKEARFTAFLKKKTRLYDQVAKSSNGNLVLIEEIFQHGNHLYTVSERIRWDKLSIAEISRLPEDTILTIIRSLLDSLKRMHGAGVVHADLRPENILLKPTVAGFYATKIIDFDNSFICDDPPINPDSFSLDPVYAAPESVRFVQGQPLVLGRGIDVFSLGLLIHSLLSGEMPGFARSEYQYASAAVNAGQPLKLSRRLDSSWEHVIKTMLSGNAESRPKIEEVYTAFVRPVHQKMNTNKPDSSRSNANAASQSRMASKPRVNWHQAPNDLSHPW